MISRELVYLGDFREESLRLRNSWGKTEKFTTGHRGLDLYLGGGFGRDDGYEIVLLYGPTGVGKSMVSLNFLAPAILADARIGLLVLEDDMVDVSLRLQGILGDEDYAKINQSQNIVCLPRDALSKRWTLPELLKYIEDWFTVMNLDLILLDHLQFAFEGAESIKGENEYTSQRVFMRDLNHLMKKVKKTIILVSHVNKSRVNGMDKIVGSGALAQAATKVVEVDREDGKIKLFLRKSRFTEMRDYHWLMQFRGAKMESITNELPKQFR